MLHPELPISKQSILGQVTDDVLYVSGQSTMALADMVLGNPAQADFLPPLGRNSHLTYSIEKTPLEKVLHVFCSLGFVDCPPGASSETLDKGQGTMALWTHCG